MSNLCSTDLNAVSVSDMSEMTTNTNMSVDASVVDDGYMTAMRANPVLRPETMNFIRAKCDVDEFVITRSSSYIVNDEVNVAMDHECVANTIQRYAHSELPTYRMTALYNLISRARICVTLHLIHP